MTPPTALLTPLLLVNPATFSPPPLAIHNLTLPPSRLPYHCTPGPRWMAPSLLKDDCHGALGYLYYETMEQGGQRCIEFLSRGAKATRHLKREATPRKYTFGTCTLAIVLLDDYPSPTTLPGGPLTGPPTDTSTYSRLNLVAQNVVERCVVVRGEAGWQAAGQHDGIGVFVWATDSAEDKEIGDKEGGGDRGTA